MKLRIHKSNLRLRLSQSEAASLARGQAVQQTTVFAPAARFVCGIEPAPTPHLTASFEGGRLWVRVPLNWVQKWAASDHVAIKAMQSAGAGEELEILIEKDFQCLHGGPERRDHDAFANPAAP